MLIDSAIRQDSTGSVELCSRLRRGGVLAGVVAFSVVLGSCVEQGTTVPVVGLPAIEIEAEAHGVRLDMALEHESNGLKFCGTIRDTSGVVPICVSVDESLATATTMVEQSQGVFHLLIDDRPVPHNGPYQLVLSEQANPGSSVVTAYGFIYDRTSSNRVNLKIVRRAPRAALPIAAAILSTNLAFPTSAQADAEGQRQRETFIQKCKSDAENACKSKGGVKSCTPFFNYSIGQSSSGFYVLSVTTCEWECHDQGGS